MITPSLPFNDLRSVCLALFHAVLWSSVPNLFLYLFPIFEVLVLRLPLRVALDWEMACPSFDRYPAEIGELGYDCLTTEAAVSAGFDSAEGHLCFVANCGAIDVAHPRLDSFCDHQSTGDIAAKDCSGETKLGVIGDTHGVYLILGPNDGNNRAE